MEVRLAALPFGLGVTELIIILVIILILFGPKRLPALGKSIGKTMRSIREGAEESSEDEDDEELEAEESPKPKKKPAKDEDEDE
jgi:sec-independent protein translocase protein TatA